MLAAPRRIPSHFSPQEMPCKPIGPLKIVKKMISPFSIRVNMQILHSISEKSQACCFAMGLMSQSW